MATLIATLGMALAACGGSEAAPRAQEDSEATSWTSRHEQNVDGARALVRHLLENPDDAVELTQALRPRPEDYRAVFSAEADAAAVEAAHAALWSAPDAAIRGKEGQTEVLIWTATGRELAAGTGDASRFPGGYEKVADRLAPELSFYRFKFVEPGATLGMAFDGLVHVNGRWCFVPKPWQALD